MTISYRESQRHHELMHYSQRQTPKEIDRTEVKQMTEQKWDEGVEYTDVNWDEVLKSDGKFLKLEADKRVTLVGKNARQSIVEKQFPGKEMKEYAQITLDIIEMDGVECEKVLQTISKRMIFRLEPLFKGVPRDQEVRFSIKRIEGKEKTDTTYDVEAL